MKPEQVTYDRFLELAIKMQEKGEKLSVRAVHGRLGGSFSKVSAFIRQFEQERANISAIKQTDLSEHVRQAILSEIGRAVSEAKDTLMKQMAQLKEQLDEANEHLAAQESVLRELKAELSDHKEKLLLSNKSVEDLLTNKKTFKQQLADAHNASTKYMLEASQLKSQLERTERSNDELKDLAAELQKKLESETKQKYEAEKRAAVAEAKLQVTAK